MSNGHRGSAARSAAGGMVAARLAAAVMTAAAAWVLGSCTNTAPMHRDYGWTKDVGRDLDVVGKALDDLGTISMSSPLVAPPRADDPTFSFKLSNTAQDYFNSAKTEISAASASLTQEMNDAGVGLKLQADLSATLGTVSDLSAYAGSVAGFQARQNAQEAAARAGSQQILAAVPANATAAQRATAEAASQQYLADHLPGPTSQPAYPSARATTLPSVDADLNQSAADKAKDVFSSAQFSKLRELLGSKSPVLSSRAALNIAAGDNATAAIFSVLGNPAKYANFKDKRILLGVSMVSVSPGRKTQQHYAADIALTVRYGWRPARAEVMSVLAARESAKPGSSGLSGADAAALKSSLSDLISATGRLKGEAGIRGITGSLGMMPMGGSGALPVNFGVKGGSSTGGMRTCPLVAAVSPMTDAEVTDATNGAREQKSFALTLAAALEFAGLKGQANIFDKWAKRFETEVETRSASAAISAYSHSGGIFGFQIGPRLRAVANAKKGGPIAASILERQAFPVLVIIGMDEADFSLRMERINNEVVVLEPVLEFSETTRWQPLDSSAASILESSRLGLMTTMMNVLDQTPPDKDELGINPVATYVHNRTELLAYESLGSSNWQYLPLDVIEGPHASVDTKDPSFSMALKGTHSLVIHGQNLEGISTATIGDKVAVLNHMGDDTVLVTFSGADANLKSDVVYDLVLGGTRDKLFAGKVTFNAEKEKEDPAKGKPFMAIGRDATGRVTSIDFAFPKDSSLDRPQILELMEKTLEADQAHLQLNASGGFDYHVGGSAQVSPATQPGGH